MTKDALQQAVRDAMRARDRDRLAALRQVLSIVRNAEIDRGAEATEADVTAATRKALRMAREELDALSASPAGREARIASISAQAAALGGMLPAQVGGAELEALVTEAIGKVGASTRRDTGRVIAEVSARTGGNVDKGEVARLVAAALS